MAGARALAAAGPWGGGYVYGIAGSWGLAQVRGHWNVRFGLMGDFKSATHNLRKDMYYLNFKSVTHNLFYHNMFTCYLHIDSNS
jgi:hypothetical protein